MQVCSIYRRTEISTKMRGTQMALRFLSTKEVSERLGVKNASEYKLPEPDVYMALLKVSYLNNR